jgi:hypothetical protein
MSAGRHGYHVPGSIELGRNCRRSESNDCESGRESERTIGNHHVLIRWSELSEAPANGGTPGLRVPIAGGEQKDVDRAQPGRLANVRFGSLADIPHAMRHVRFSAATGPHGAIGSTSELPKAGKFTCTSSGPNTAHGIPRITRLGR